MQRSLAAECGCAFSAENLTAGACRIATTTDLDALREFHNKAVIPFHWH